jgi:carbon monoxide dehydrogenase subunit G
MRFDEAFTVPIPRDSVWEFFQDIPRVAACVPGVEDVSIVDDSVSRVRVTQKVGSMSATFDLKMAITEKRPVEYIEFSAVGRTVKGASGTLRAKNEVRFEEVPQGTGIRLSSDVALGGMLGSMGRNVVASKAKEVTDAFARALQAEMEGWTGPAPSG